MQVNLDKMLNSRTQDGSLTHNRWIFISFLVDISSPLQLCIFPALLASYPNWMRIASPAARGAAEEQEDEKQTKSIMFLKGHQNKHRRRPRNLSLSLSYFPSCRTSELLCKCQTERNVAPLRSRSLFTSFDIPSAIDDDRPPRSPAHACATGRDRYGMLSTAKVTSSIPIGRIFRIQPGIECLIKFRNSFSH